MRRTTLACCFAVVLASPVLAAPRAPLSETLVFGGVERSYLVYAGAPTGARGLVLLLHGHAGSAEQLLDPRLGRSPYKVWRQIADRERLVLVAPDGIKGGDGRRGWNDCRGASTNPTTDDVGFLEALVKKLSARHGVPEGDAFVVGTSNGGVMTLRLAVERPRLFRAFAAVVAELPAASRCAQPTTPVPILFMNGTADALMPYGGGEVAREAGRGAVLSTDATVAFFAKLNRATGSPRVEALPDLDTKDRSRVTRLTWSPAEGGAPVVLYRVDGGGHVEPSRAERYRRLVTAVLGPQNGDVEMADEVWSFFKGRLPSHP